MLIFGAVPSSRESEISTFQNDITSFRNKNDVLTLLIHLGYLAYDSARRETFHENRYDGDLNKYFGNLLLVGINYDKEAKGKGAKRHSCVIERA